MAMVRASGPCPRIARQMSSAGPIKPHSVPNPASNSQSTALNSSRCFVFLCGEVAQRLRAKRLRDQAIVGLVADERHYKRLHQLKKRQVAPRADLVQLEFFRLAEKIEWRRLRKGLGQKRPREVQSSALTSQILQPPVHALRSFEQFR